MTFEKAKAEIQPPGSRHTAAILAEAMFQGIAPPRASRLFFFLLFTGKTGDPPHIEKAACWINRGMKP